MDIEKVNILMENLSKSSNKENNVDDGGVVDNKKNIGDKKNIYNEEIVDSVKNKKQYRLADIQEEIIEIEPQPYRKRSYFFSVAELKFFEVLKEIIRAYFYSSWYTRTISAIIYILLILIIQKYVKNNYCFWACYCRK